jgi:hypothetical protein
VREKKAAMQIPLMKLKGTMESIFTAHSDICVNIVLEISISMYAHILTLD